MYESARLLSPQDRIRAEGILKELPKGNVSSLAARASSFFRDNPTGPNLLIGAIPFDRSECDFLYQPSSVVREPVGEVPRVETSGETASKPVSRITLDPSIATYAESVQRCLALMAEASGPEPLRKVVLARSLVIEQTQPIEVTRLVRRLARDRSVWTFQTPLGSAEDGTPRVLAGATPELLVSKRGEEVVSHPLAGSARRHDDPNADRAAAEHLQNSAKDRREHDTVVEAVLDTLAPYCRRLEIPDGTRLRPTATMWHLGTRIVGTLIDREIPVAELLAALHPTPAVCGLPRERARDVIRELEPFDRGFYAGAVGWADSAGDGEWYVAIRCAEISGNRARLFAGAGIVAGSDPQSEAEETAAKFAALLDALTTDDFSASLRGSES